MDRALGGLECVFEAIDLVSQPIALSTQLVPLTAETIALTLDVGPLPIPFGPLSAQPFNLALLPLQLGDQVVARRGAPARSHALVMPRLVRKYKRKVTCSRRSAIITEVRTR